MCTIVLSILLVALCSLCVSSESYDNTPYHFSKDNYILHSVSTFDKQREISPVILKNKTFLDFDNKYEQDKIFKSIEFYKNGTSKNENNLNHFYFQSEKKPKLDFNMIQKNLDNQFSLFLQPKNKTLSNDIYDIELPEHLQCPVCFKLIKQQILNQILILRNLTQQLKDIKNNPEVIKDVSFQFKLRELLSTVEILLRDARYAQKEEQNLIKQLLELKEKIHKLIIAKDQITHLPEIARQLKLASSNVSLAEETLFRITNGVQDTRNFLNNQANNALYQAWERSRKFGHQSQRLSDIAREARHLAQGHFDDSIEIFKIATKSLNTSQVAYKLARDAVSTQELNKIAINKLKSQMFNTQILLNKVMKISNEARQEASKAYNDALDLYSKSAPLLPTFKSDKINQDSIWIITQAKKIMEEVDRLLEKYEVAINGSQNKLISAEHLLKEVERLQLETNRLLKETQHSYNNALKAVESGELTLKDAQNTLKILKEFDELVLISKAKAKEALIKMEEIHNLIKNAEMKTEEAERALKGALQDALEAKEIALEAQAIAEKASSQVRKIKENALQVRHRSTELRKRVEIFSIGIEESSKKVTQIEGDGEDDGKNVKETLEKANAAKNMANDAINKIKITFHTLESILEELNGLQQIDAGLFEELFQRLAKAEQEYRDAELDSRTETLNKAKELQRKWIINYERLIAKLQADVANVQKIRQAIPEKCFRRIRLEP